MIYEDYKIEDPTILAHISASIVKFYQHETPVADKIEILKVIPVAKNAIRALVQLTVMINRTAKTSVSVIKAKTDAHHCIVPDTVIYPE